METLVGGRIRRGHVLSGQYTPKVRRRNCRVFPANDDIALSGDGALPPDTSPRFTPIFQALGTLPTPARYTGRNPIVWVDVETTTNDPLVARLLEIAIVITDEHLNEVDSTGLQYVIHADDGILNTMPPKVVEMHARSGLTQACRSSSHDMRFVEAEVLKYIKKWIPTKNHAVFGGSSVHFDRTILLREMPSVVEHLNYRILDVSTIMKVAEALYPGLSLRAPSPMGNHRAMVDIRNSIAQYKYYRRHLFRSFEDVQRSTRAEVSQRLLAVSRSMTAVVATANSAQGGEAEEAAAETIRKRRRSA